MLNLEIPVLIYRSHHLYPNNLGPVGGVYLIGFWIIALY